MEFRFHFCVIVTIILCLGCSDSGRKRTKRKLPTNDPVVGNVWREYQENELAADQKYKGKWVEITRFLWAVEKGKSGYRVRLVTREPGGINSPGYKADLTIPIDNQHKGNLKSARKLDLLTIHAVCQGKFDDHIILEHGKIVKIVKHN